MQRKAQRHHLRFTSDMTILEQAKALEIQKEN